jgi:hypothetical protein
MQYNRLKQSVILVRGSMRIIDSKEYPEEVQQLISDIFDACSKIICICNEHENTSKPLAEAKE